MSAARHAAGVEAGLRLLQQGRGDEAVAALEAAAASGDRAAALLLGQALLHGDPLAPDPAAAVRHLERAARDPWGPPEQLLAAVLWIGHGVDADPERAWHWLARALGAGHAPALRTAGLLRATRGDAVGARDLLARAGDAGDAFARHALGVLAAARGAGDEARRLLGASPLPASMRRLRALERSAWPIDGAPWSPGSGTPPWTDPPRRGQALPLATAPRIEVQDAGLSPWECDYLMTVGAPNLRRSRTVDPKGASVHADPARTSADASLRTLFPDLVVHDAALAMAGLAGLPLARSEALALLQYGVGQEYRRHFDALAPGTLESPRWRDQGQRVTTVIAYLADVPAGGATSFPELGLEVEARAGRLVRFDNVDAAGAIDPRSLHCGEPVRAGEKWVVTAWFRERPAPGYFGGQVPGRS